MSLIEIKWNPPDRQLRQFGWICPVALPVVAWIWGGGWAVVSSCAAVGCVIALIGTSFPQALRPVFLALSIAAAPIGMIVGEIALLLIFFGVFLPIGIVFRLAGRDPLQLRINRSATSYWQNKAQPRNAASYYRQS